MNKERNIIDEREVWITMEEKVKRDDGCTEKKMMAQEGELDQSC